MKLDVLICRYRNMDGDCLPLILRCIDACNNAGIETNYAFYGNAMLHAARNDVLSGASEADRIMFIDDDMFPLEADAILRLIELNAPVATALCTTRNHPVELALKIWDEKREVWLQAEQNRVMDRPVTGKYGIGAAWMMMTQEARQTLIDHYLSANDWLMDNRRSLDRMHVRNEYRDKERAEKSRKRREKYEAYGYIRVFGHFVDETEEESGEDIGFSRRLMQCGIDVTVDPSIVVGHMGKYPYSTNDYIPKHLQPEKMAGLRERLAS